ncbi:MAG TPA: ankyrin repeat domain-containing protein, partial [Bacteroidales bacterium]|nr:ankyrin repeat domain-containing protein [Bacteroidales bacterium]
LYSVPDREGKFPIHYLAENETDSLFAYALNPDITEIQQVDSNGFTPIHYAAKKTNGYEMVEYLLNHKADINAKIPDITYREELYELYFEHDNKTYFRFNKRIWSDFFRSPENWYIQYHGCTPLHLACSVPNNLDVVKIFVENGADINAIHQIIGTPLHVAISYGSDLELIRYLVENGANLNIKNYAGMTPAEFAKNLNANETYKYLKEIGGK